MIQNLFFYNSTFTFEICFFILLLILLIQRTGFSISTTLTNYNIIQLVYLTVKLLFFFIEIYFICFIFKFYFFSLIKWLLIIFNIYFHYILLIKWASIYGTIIWYAITDIKFLLWHYSILFIYFYKFIIIYCFWIFPNSQYFIISLNIKIYLLTIQHSFIWVFKFLLLLNFMILKNCLCILYIIKNQFIIIIELLSNYYILAVNNTIWDLLSYYSFLPIFNTSTFWNISIVSDISTYNLFHYNIFSLYNKYLILIFIILYYIIIYLYYLIPTLLNLTSTNLKLNFLFKYEYPILIGFLLLGYTLVINSNNLFIVYLGFEIQTFIILILSGQLRLFLTVITTSLKYFFLSILSSLLFLMSLLYLYNFSGTLNFYELNYFLIYNWTTDSISGNFIFIGLICLLFSFFFKLGVFPFYIWILDIFEGFPSLITLLLLTLNKFNLYIFLIKFLSIISSFNIIVLNLLLHILTIVSLSSLFFGSLLAISQTSIHRFFAATSITHMGFLLLGLKINLYLITYEKSNSFNILYSYFILYLLHTLIIFFILIFWSGLLNSYINKIYYSYKTNFYFNCTFSFIKDFVWFNLFSKKIILIIILLLFNLSGFPPFSFFYIKLNLILLLLYNYAYFDTLSSLYFSIIITGSYIRLISLIYLENNFFNFNTKKLFKYIYQLIASNNHLYIKQIYMYTESCLLLITFIILFYNYFIFLL